MRPKREIDCPPLLGKIASKSGSMQMRQTVLSVVLDVEPQSAQRLSGLIEQFKHDQEEGRQSYIRLKEEVPALHFMAMSVFESSQFDPIFVIEANFDGPPGPFWAQMEAAFGVRLRPMLRCCKRPEDGDGPVYDAVTKPFSRYPLAPYLEKRTLQSQRLPSGQSRPRARPHPAGRRAFPGDPRRAGATQSDRAQSLSRHHRPGDSPQAARPAARPLSLAGDAGAGAHFLDRTVGGSGAAPGLRLPRPFLPVDSRHGVGAGHAGLAVPRFDRAAGWIGGVQAVAHAGAFGRRGRADALGWTHDRQDARPRTK